MDELTAVRQLLAEPPPPAPDVVAAARARLERATRDTGDSQVARPAPPLAARGSSRPGRGRGGRARHRADRRFRGSEPGRSAERPGARLPGRRRGGRAARPSAPGSGCSGRRRRALATAGPAAVPSMSGPPPTPRRRRGSTGARSSASRFGPFVGQPQPSVVPQDRGGGWAVGGQSGKIPVSYAGLSSLPRDPAALDRYLRRLSVPHPRGWGSPAAREFTIIEMMLASYVMPPRLTAELYRALGQIPGVRVDDHAVDVAGRPASASSARPCPARGTPRSSSARAPTA